MIVETSWKDEGRAILTDETMPQTINNNCKWLQYRTDISFVMKLFFEEDNDASEAAFILTTEKEVVKTIFP